MYCAALLLLGALVANGAAASDNIKPILDARIIGGHRVNIQDFPYQVSVRHKSTHRCGGTILSASIILTAAHCFEVPLNPSDYSIQYGVTYIGGDDQVIDASLVLRHRNFNSKTRDNNVAIIYLTAQIPFSNVAQPILLASEKPAVGSKAFISGWGAHNSKKGADAESRRLRYAEVTIVKNSKCLKEYRKVDEKFDSDGMLCAGISDGDSKDGACAGDAGGALVADGLLYGVIASGLGCGERDDFYGLYASVPKLRSWIEYYANLYY